MTKYRNKPVVIEAEVFKVGMEDGIETVGVSESTINEFGPIIESWYGKVAIRHSQFNLPYIINRIGNRYSATEKHYITKGDYIITGIAGERYPCKPDIFEKTYEKVNGHLSDCAVHNMPAMPNGDCTCGYEKVEEKVSK